MNGIARLTINLMSGEYIITSMYEPNGAAISNKVTVKVEINSQIFFLFAIYRNCYMYTNTIFNIYETKFCEEFSWKKIG